MLHSEFKKQQEIVNKLNTVRDIYRSQQKDLIISNLQTMIHSEMYSYSRYTLPDSCIKYVVEYDYIDIKVSGYSFAQTLNEVLNLSLGFIGDVYFYELDHSGYIVDQDIVSDNGDTYLLRIDKIWSYLK